MLSVHDFFDRQACDQIADICNSENHVLWSGYFYRGSSAKRLFVSTNKAGLGFKLIRSTSFSN